MLVFSPLYNLPIWTAGLFFLVIFIVSLELGFRLGLKRKKFWKDADSGGGAIVVTSMFALMGLVIAFTYASGISRYDARKNAVTVEANALNVAFHRADLVAEPGRTELRNKLLDYARTRIIPKHEIATNEMRNDFLKTTLNKLSKLWPAVKRIVEQGKPGPIETSMVASINKVMDAHTVRLTAAMDKLPGVVIWLLVFVASASLAVAGLNAGIQGRISRLRMSVFALVLSSLIFVILDFDRPNTGLVIVNDSTIKLVVSEMEKELSRCARGFCEGGV